jgi:hypothetical protein
MSAQPPTRIRQQFDERVGEDKLTGRMVVLFRLVGGMPHERLDETVRLSGTGAVTVSQEDALAGRPRHKRSTKLSRAQTREIFREVNAGLDSLIPRAHARFPMDSLVGSITIAVNGEEETFYFIPDSTGHIAPDKRISGAIVAAVDRFKGIARRLERHCRSAYGASPAAIWGS